MLEMQECFLFLGEVKENVFNFWQGTVKYSCFKTILPAVLVIDSWYKELHFRCAGIPWFASNIPNNNWQRFKWQKKAIQIQAGTNEKHVTKILSVIHFRHQGT